MLENLSDLTQIIQAVVKPRESSSFMLEFVHLTAMSPLQHVLMLHRKVYTSASVYNIFSELLLTLYLLVSSQVL